MEGRYAAIVIGGAALAVLIPWLGLGWSFQDALYRGMTLLVVASPCALVISIPVTVVSAVSNGTRHGILFKGGAHLDALATIRVAAFDKTGTLAVGRPEVVGVRAERAVSAAVPVAGGPADGFGTPAHADDTDRLIELAAAAESRSEHPLAAAILREAERRGLTVPSPASFDSSAGHGVSARIEEREVRVGRRSWIETIAGEPAPFTRTELFSDGLEGATPVYVTIVILGDDLAALGHAVELSHRTRRIVRHNLVFAVAVMLTLLGLASFGLIGLTTGVIGHEGSTIVVVFNGLRLLRDGKGFRSRA